MKFTILTVVAVLLIAVLYACNQKKAQQTTGSPSVSEPTDNPPPKPYQVVGFRKTACFGKCPVYEVKFYSDNRATWHGKMNVDKMGWYEAQLEGKTIKAIRDKAHEVGYFDFHNEYPVEHKIADLPSTITYLRIGDVEKKIKNTHDGPEKLAEFQHYLLDVINRLDWQATAKE